MSCTCGNCKPCSDGERESRIEEGFWEEAHTMRVKDLHAAVIDGWVDYTWGDEYLVRAIAELRRGGDPVAVLEAAHKVLVEGWMDRMMERYGEED